MAATERPAPPTVVRSTGPVSPRSEPWERIPTGLLLAALWLVVLCGVSVLVAGWPGVLGVLGLH